MPMPPGAEWSTMEMTGPTMTFESTSWESSEGMLPVMPMPTGGE